MILVSVVPSAVVGFLLKPLVFFVLGPDKWREQLARVKPFRWWIGSSPFALALAITVYGISYG